MNGVVLITILVAVAIGITALITRLQSSRSGVLSEEERQRKREVAKLATERGRKAMSIISATVLVALVTIAFLSYRTNDPSLKQAGFLLSGFLAIPFLVIFAKCWDDGLYPELKRKPNKSTEPTDVSAPR